MNQSESINKLAPALVAAQAEIGGAVKGSENPFFKSQYADLNTVILALKPIFVKHGFAVIQLPVSDGNGVGVSTRVQHESGEFIEESFTLPLAKGDPQTAGSAITYAKRYALKALGLMPDLDDDAEGAMFRQKKDYTEYERAALIDLMSKGDGWGLKKLSNDVGGEVMTAMFNSFKKGEVSKNKELARQLIGAANNELRESLAFIENTLNDPDMDSKGAIDEHLAEIDEMQLAFTRAGLNEVQLRQLEAEGIQI